ncbi:MAG TPA: OmpA family protein [Gammaproteobacteria bacterium]|nr:OmpA family protein [Gammaproteobacteria bacterium]
MHLRQIFQKTAVLTVILLIIAITSKANDLITARTVVTAQTPFIDMNYQSRLIDQLRTQGVKIIFVGHEMQVVLGVDHFFKGTSTTEIVPACIPVLNKVAVLLRTRGNTPITVSGHTDNVGTDQGKLRRSKQQADTIAAYLWSQGIPLTNLTALGYGDTRPVSSNKSIDGAAANRRIEIVAP